MVLRLIAAIVILTLVRGNDELHDGTTIANCIIGEETLDLEFEGFNST